MAKRKLFKEMMEGVGAMKAHREGKITLRTYSHTPAPLPSLDSAFIRETRERLRCSRAVFARKLRINERTLEKWEQGRAKPNPQAAGSQVSRHSAAAGESGSGLSLIGVERWCPSPHHAKA